jgi:hypothetical protein
MRAARRGLNAFGMDDLRRSDNCAQRGRDEQTHKSRSLDWEAAPVLRGVELTGLYTIRGQAQFLISDF